MINSVDFETFLKLLGERPLLLLATVVVGILLRLPVVQLANWLSSKKKREISQANEWLSEFSNLSPEMQRHLSARRERLLLLVTEGISVSAPMVKVLIDFSEDNLPNGITWKNLRLAQTHLRVNESNELIVQFEKGTWLNILMNLLMALLFLAFFTTLFLFPIVPVNGVAPYTEDISILLWSFAFAFPSLLMFFFFATPVANVMTARRVEKQLKTLRGTLTEAEEITA